MFNLFAFHWPPLPHCLPKKQLCKSTQISAGAPHSAYTWRIMTICLVGQRLQAELRFRDGDLYFFWDVSASIFYCDYFLCRLSLVASCFDFFFQETPGKRFIAAFCVLKPICLRISSYRKEMFIWIQCCSLQVSYTLLPENLKVFGTYLGTQLIWNINNQDTRLLKKGTRRINPKLRFLVLQRQKWIPHQLGKCSPTRSGHVQSQSVITYGKTSSIFLQDVDAAPL